MMHFRYIKVISISIIVILILSPLMQAIGEEKSSTDEGNTESMKNGGVTDYTITIRSTDKGMSIFTDSKLIGKTPLMLTLKEGESLQIYGTNKKGDVVFKTTLEGGKTPSGLLIQNNKTSAWGTKSFYMITGFGLGVFSQFILCGVIWSIIISASGGWGD